MQERINNIKFRASGAAPLFTGTLGGLTDTQEKRINELLERKKLGEKPLTENMEKELNDFIIKKNMPPQLPEGAKTYIEKCVEEIIYDYQTFTGNKEMEKGILVEDESIELKNSVFMTNDVKSESYYETEYFTGHPDIECFEEKVIHDIKSSWSKATFKTKAEDLKNSTYEWQLRLYAYMKTRMSGEQWKPGYVYHCLVNTPESLLSEWDDAKLHYVSHLSERLRVTAVPVDYTEEHVRMIETRGKMARAYAIEHYEFLINKNK